MLLDDLSRGAEKVPVRLIGDLPPPLMTYIRTCHSADSRSHAAELVGCRCEGMCLPASPCDCLGGTPCAYDEERRLRAITEPPADDGRAAPLIIECTDACCCSHRCANRVVSAGLTVPLQVFATAARGWGLRTLAPIRRGAFVCEYAGELLSSGEAACRRARRGAACNYILTVREHLPGGQVVRTTIDPTDAGNVGRFINHSCDPNLRAFVVRAGSLVPRVALFAVRDIEELQELTMFYGDGAGSTATPLATAGRTKCLCAEPCCTGFLPCDTD
ncbi:hypothetical protein AB1Y20_005082 [Prymnesium parvum]|uniref:Histone-lysine N-methyltransferase n=1 Tax=Prymnesium parvum TaxID=97485 RepID=A0AB34J4A9_PRYPA